MFGRKKMVGFLGMLLLVSFMLQPTQAYAWIKRSDHPPDRDYRRPEHFGPIHPEGRYHPRRFFGEVVFTLPSGLFSFVVGGNRYYYDGGICYRRRGLEYIVVAPPVGAVVPELPWGYQAVFVNGMPYYVADGVYYQYTPRGYLIVPQPIVTVVSAPSTAVILPAASDVQRQDDIFTVNIPNRDGSYSPITIKRTGNGFIGPQGELYSEFPKVEQLKVMYGK